MKKPFGSISSIFISTFIFLVILGGVGLIALNKYTGSLTTFFIEKKSGFPTSVDRSMVQLQNGKLVFERFIIENPSSFEDKHFVDINQLAVDIHPSSLFSDKLEAESIVVNIETAAYVKNKAGNVNALIFSDAFKSGEKKSDKAKPETTESKPFHIKTFTFRLNNGYYADYTGSKPSIKTIPLNYERTFTDVTQVEQILNPIIQDLSKAGAAFLAQAVLSSLVDLDFYKDLSRQLLQQTGPLMDMGNNAVESTGNAVSKGFNSLKQGLFGGNNENNTSAPNSKNP